MPEKLFILIFVVLDVLDISLNHIKQFSKSLDSPMPIVVFASSMNSHWHTIYHIIKDKQKRTL